MRKTAVLPLLLLGLLRMAVLTATPPAAGLAPTLRIESGLRGAAPMPAEDPGAIKRLAEAPRASALPRDEGPAKHALAAAPGPVPAGGRSPRRPEPTGPAAASNHSPRPVGSRAPPFRPSF